MEKLQYDSYEEIKEKVVETFEKHQINEIPIDCFKLAKKLGFSLVPYSTLATENVKKLKIFNGEAFTIVLVDTGEKIIYYDDSYVIGKQRFTILHEIGHFVLDHREESDLAKMEADFFAKYALAPMPLIHKLKIDDYIDLSKKFKTSEECAYYIMECYNKWLQYGPQDYTSYEARLITLFSK